MTQMGRKEFFKAIAEGYFEDLTTDLQGMKDMISSAVPVFGTLEVEIEDKDTGGKKLTFIDRDDADLVLAPEGIDTDEVDTDMTTTIITIHLDEHDVIRIVEHGFNIFTPANKNFVLLYASLIGKKILFEGE
jgi:septum formation inhibitor-activating ATPase MinD